MFCAAVTCLLMIGVAVTQLSERRTAPELSTEAQLPPGPMFPPPYVPASINVVNPIDAVAPTRAASRPPTSKVRQERPPAEPGATTGATATRRPTSAPAPAAPPRPAPEPTREATTPPAPGLRVGDATSLELSGAPGMLVRHRDFRGRVDRIGPGSSAGDRADARFIVREGLAGAGCVSFESSNYPGYFLRHRNFELRLDRRDRTRLFDQDASFCPETRGSASVVVLRSLNYPDRFVTENRSQLRLTPATTGTATRFVVRPPL